MNKKCSFCGQPCHGNYNIGVTKQKLVPLCASCAEKRIEIIQPPRRRAKRFQPLGSSYRKVESND